MNIGFFFSLFKENLVRKIILMARKFGKWLFLARGWTGGRAALY